MRTKTVCKASNCFLFAHRSNHRYNSGTQISAATWQTVHEHIEAMTCFNRRGAH